MKKEICFIFGVIVFLAFALSIVSGKAVASQQNIRAGLEEGVEQEIKTEDGERVRLRIEESERLEIKTGNVSACTDLKLDGEYYDSGTKLMVQLSNGRKAEIKIMPDVASERALERLRLKVCSSENNCSIELKEVGQNKEEKRLAYEIKAEKKARIFGLFRARMKVESQIDAETGEIIFSKKPWWAFLASESGE